MGLGAYTVAAEEFESLLPLIEEKVGSEHSNALRAVRQYAAVLRRAGRAEQARLQLARILKIYRVRYGENHIDTTSATAALANVLLALGETQAALQRAEAAGSAYGLILGSEQRPFHRPRTAAAGAA